ncbi:unnamed protein product [Lymnaea stagnalis]|uniref:protein-tyrosine-phosphatase n=1 Tax=Lymnaea stagnalis TaxID=6523 RepID=A0AAV2I155_LYMST
MGGSSLRVQAALLATVLTILGPPVEAGPPKITMAPKNSKVAEEATVSFFCRASGNPAPSFHWEKDGKRMNNRRQRHEIIEAPHVTALRIKPVKAKDNSTYTCVANNGLGEARADASLYIYPKIEGGEGANPWVVKYEDFPQGYPRIETHPKLKSVEKDRPIQLACEVKGDPKPSIMWLKDSLPVDTTDPRVEVLESGYLTIQHSQESDEATYECVAENEFGVAFSYKAMVYIKVRRIAPKFSRAPDDIQVQPGSDVNLTCLAVGSPMPFVKWRQGAQDLTGDDNIPIGKNVLMLNDVRMSKNYTCEASSDLGNIEHNVQVIVGAPGTPPENIIAKAITSTDITVTWDEPKITNGIITGYKLFYTLKPEDPIFFWEQLEIKQDIRSTTISGLQPNATYAVSVLAYSSIGQGPMSHPVQVLTTQGVPYQPLNLKASAISPNAIEVHWDPPQEADTIKSYELYYNDSHFRQTNRFTIDPPVNNYRISGLTPDTVYHIQVSAKSSRGEGPKTPTIQVQTPPFKPEAPPENITGKHISEMEIQIWWKPPNPLKLNGKLKGYKVYVVENGGGKADKEPMMKQVEGDELTANVKDLKTWTEYRVWVVAFNQVGDGPGSTPIIVRTDEAVPGEPRRIRVEPVNSTSLMVEWEPPSSKEQNGIIRGYQVYYVEANGYDEPLPGVREHNYDTFDEKKTSAIITGLKADTRYLVQVAAYTRKGDGFRSKSKVHTTKGAVPSQPRHLNVDLIQEDPPSVKVTWQRPAETHGDIKNYKIIWGPRGERYEEIILSPEIYSFLTNTLDKGITYEFRVSAKNEIDYGERAVSTITTPDGAPSGAPQNFTATGLTETSVRLTWDLPARNLRNGEIVMYQITYHKLSDPINEEDVNCTDTFLDLVSLDMNTDYSFKIKAYTSRGAGPWSNRLHFRTFGKMPPPPKNVKVRRTSDTTLEVKWDDPDGPVSGYKIFYNTFVTPNMHSWQQLEIGPYTVADITNLDPQTVYAVRIQAKSVDGRFGNMSETVTLNVEDTLRDDSVQRFRVTQRLINVIKLSWEKPKIGEVQTYILSYKGLKSYREDGVTQYVYQNLTEVQIQGNQNAYTLENLRPKMKFEFNITPIFRDGKDGYTEHASAETLIDAPPRVERPLIRTIQQYSILLTLKRASDRNGPISHYHVIVVPSIFVNSLIPLLLSIIS